MGPCAKARVFCTLVHPDGRRWVGENVVRNPQAECPRGDLPSGVGYEICRDVCGQEGHAEINALVVAGDGAKGCTAYVEGRHYICENCQVKMKAAGVVSMVLGTPAPGIVPVATVWIDVGRYGREARFGKHNMELLEAACKDGPASVYLTQPPSAAPSTGQFVLHGYVAAARDGHETYFKGDPATSAFHNESWRGLMEVIPLYRPAPSAQIADVPERYRKALAMPDGPGVISPLVQIADDHAGDERTTALIKAAEERADAYDGDDRSGIKNDVINAFYAGSEWERRRATQPPTAPVLDEDPRITAFYKLRDIAERDEDVESANIIASAISQLHWSRADTAQQAATCQPTALPENWRVREAVNLKRRSITSMISDAAVSEIMDAVRSLCAAPTCQGGAQEAKPMYQAQFDGEYGSSVWRDVTEAAYHTFIAKHRRIVYAAPVPVAAEDARDAARLDLLYKMAMVEPFISPIATKEKWLDSVDREIEKRAAMSSVTKKE